MQAIIQNVIILIVVAICAFFIIRRFTRKLKGTGSNCGCCSSGTCGPDISSSCQTKPPQTK